MSAFGTMAVWTFFSVLWLLVFFAILLIWREWTKPERDKEKR